MKYTEEQESIFDSLRVRLGQMIEEANYDREWVEGELRNRASVADILVGLQAWSIGGISAEAVVEELLK